MSALLTACCCGDKPPPPCVPLENGTPITISATWWDAERSRSNVALCGPPPIPPCISDPNDTSLTPNVICCPNGSGTWAIVHFNRSIALQQIPMTQFGFSQIGWFGPAWVLIPGQPSTGSVVEYTCPTPPFNQGFQQWEFASPDDVVLADVSITLSKTGSFFNTWSIGITGEGIPQINPPWAFTSNQMLDQCVGVQWGWDCITETYLVNPNSPGYCCKSTQGSTLSRSITRAQLVTLTT